ncbi:MAG: deoxyribose-phosphate aldolase [Erysipelotrichaceae bacterium]|nr:deoxyribose-phosphate aldolase [Erysipelotrichaceae bacterium]
MSFSRYIDHTNLKQNATQNDIAKLCDEAKTYHFASVCVNPYWVSYCAELLKDTDVNVCTVIGFPLGATSTASKAFEAKQAILDGATEVDMVINVGEVKAQHDEAVYEDIKAVKEAAKNETLKVIIETCLLTDEEKVRACKLSVKAGADFVKTSTGFSTGGATVHDVKLMKDTVGDACEVKASGGIHTREEMLALIDAGATRIGASAGIALIQED